MRTVCDRCTSDRPKSHNLIEAAGHDDHDARSVHAMLSGMVVMVVPALFICIGIAIMAYRRRDRFARRASIHRKRTRR